MAAPQAAPDLPEKGAEADPLLGRVLNSRCTIVAAVGNGGMWRVYKALQAPLDPVVALKVLGAGHDRDPNFYKRFFLEASVTAKLTHPNTITLYDYGRTEDGVFFIAMEYLNGRTLSQVMQAEGPLAQERVIHIAQQICRSLREAHALGIIHRDLKPANVMLLVQHDDHDFVKVLDFGLVKFFREDNTEGDITNAGTFMGSPHYVAPEQARNQAPDQRCDIYSLGVLAFYMLTGTVPFTAPNPVDIILRHLHELPPRPSEQRPELHIDASLEEIVLRCMAKDRAERFQSMDELLGELKNVRQRLAPLASATPSYATPLAVTPLTTPPPPPADSVEVVLARWPLTRRELIRYGAGAGPGGGHAQRSETPLPLRDGPHRARTAGERDRGAAAGVCHQAAPRSALQHRARVSGPGTHIGGARVFSQVRGDEPARSRARRGSDGAAFRR